MAKILNKKSVDSEEDPLFKLVKFEQDFKYDDLSVDIIKFAKQELLDTLGVMIGGSSQDGIAQIVRYVEEQGGKGEFTVPFYGTRVPAAMAGLAIGPMARALDLGDVHVDAGHTGEYVLPPLMAATGLKKRISGRDFLVSYILGNEVNVRVGIADRFHDQVGQYNAHVINGFGPTLGVAKLLGLNEEETLNAMGIARVVATSIDWQMFVEGTLMVRTLHGFIARDAIISCQLAQRGITGPHKIFLGEAGYLHQFCPFCEPYYNVLTEGLGLNWHYGKTGFKAFAACLAVHSACSGIIDCIAENNIKINDIKKIHLDVSEEEYHLNCEDKELRWNPTTVVDCQFSMPYCVATAAIKGKVFLDDYTKNERKRPDVRKLMTKITASASEDLPMWSAVVNVTLNNGSHYTKRCDYAKGTPENPMTFDETVEKFKNLVPYSYLPISEQRVKEIISKILKLETVNDVVEEVWSKITP